MIGKKQNRASARVVDGKLILSFPHAATPVVWQMDLTDAKNSAYEIREVSEDKTIVMTSRQQNSQKTDVIASFNTREDAVEALMATSHALENAHGQIVKPSGVMSLGQSNQSVATTTSPSPANTQHVSQSRGASWGTWAAVFAGIGLVVVLYGMVQSMTPRSPLSVQSADLSSLSAPQASNSSDSAGVPVSADDFLMQR